MLLLILGYQSIDIVNVFNMIHRMMILLNNSCLCMLYNIT